MEEKEFNYINVIPLVDVMLVLLTIVLTTASFIATGMIPLDLPKVVKSQGEMLKTQTVEIDRQGALFFNARRVSLDALKGSLENRSKTVSSLPRNEKVQANPKPFVREEVKPVPFFETSKAVDPSLTGIHSTSDLTVPSDQPVGLEGNGNRYGNPCQDHPLRPRSG